LPAPVAGSRRIMRYVHLVADVEPPDVSALRPFRAIVIADEAVPDDRRASVARWLVESGCLYMMAWGEECDAWVRAVDYANREVHDFAAIPDTRLVIGTRHENQAPIDVFWFCKHSAMHPCASLDNVVLVHLSREACEREVTAAYLSA
jgi:hypothetical protein